MSVIKPVSFQIMGIPAPSGAKGGTGTLKHSTHFVDLLLDPVPGMETNTFPGLDRFRTSVHAFIGEIEAGEIALLNEKFDGAPAIALGFDATNRPYVTYKLGIDRASGDKLVRNMGEARQHYGKGALGEIYESLIKHLRCQMLRFEDKDLIFQADVLFTPGNGAMEVTKKAVTIQPNLVVYELPAGSKFYEFAANAQIGLVVHTVARRVINPETGAISTEPIEDVEAVEKFVKAIRTPDVFVIDPWSRSVQVDRGGDIFTYEKKYRIESILEEVCANIGSLDPEFRKDWKYFLAQFKIFLNSSLQEDRSGGIYSAAVADEQFNFELITALFRAWLIGRSEEVGVTPKGKKSSRVRPVMVKNFETFLKKYRDSFFAYLKAYFDAIRIEYMLRHHMPEVAESKLGGGRTEGVMVGRVKFVDRLEFTMSNFAGGKIGRKKAKSASKPRKRAKAQPRMPQLYRKWYGSTPVSAAFFIGKLQPPHIGHIAMLRSAIETFGVDRVFVMPSLKAPDFTARHWKDLGVAATKKKLEAGLYEHVFSPALREEMLKFGLPEGVHVQLADPRTFWRYMNRNRDRKREGRVALIMGQKEIDESRFKQQFGRFADYIVPHVVEMQGGGVSATAVRQLGIRRLYETRYEDAYDFLWSAFGYIPEKERNRVIGRLIAEWKRVDNAVRRLV